MPSNSEADLPVTVYSADSPLKHPVRLVHDTFRALFDSRGLAWMLFIRDLKAQYRQSLMGYVWLFIPPVMTALVWFFLNNQRIIRVETDVPYPLFVLIGTTVWSSFVSLVNQPISGFNAGKPVFMKLKVPPEAFIMSAVFRAVFEMGIRVAIIVPLLIALRFVPPWTAVFFPLALLSVILIGLAIGIALVPVGSLYGDVTSAIGSFIGLLMYTAPVVYPVPEGGILAKIMEVNPLTPGIALSRDLLTTGSDVWLLPALVWSGISLVVIFFSLLLLRVAHPHIVARMGM